MPRAVKGTPEEREKFMFDVFEKFYSDPANAGRDLSVAKANKEHIKKFGSMLRNKRAYQIRRSVQTQAGAKGKTKSLSANRDPSPNIEAAVRSVVGNAPAALITGTQEQLEFLQSAITQLKQAGLVSLKIDHRNSTYAVVIAA